MQTLARHSITVQQPTLGGLAYWSVSAPMFSLNNDRGTEIKCKVREGWDG